MKAIGVINGLRGDIVMGTVVAKDFKKQSPNCKLTLGIHKDFSDMLPLFRNHPCYDDYHLYDGYDNWPSEVDKTYLRQEKYDFIFNQMPKHTRDDWWKFHHQCQELILSQSGQITNDLQCILNPWFNIPDNKKFVALAPIGGWYNYPNAKSLPIPRAQEIVNFILDKGYEVWQIGHRDEPKLEGTTKKDLDYFDSVKNLLGCKTFITVDTGLNWVASAYSFPTLALYSNSYYSSKYIGNIQPKNPNALYLDALNVNDIDIELIKENILKLIK